VPSSFGGNDVATSSAVRKRGVFVDLDLSLRHHDVVITARFRQLRKHPLSHLCSDDIADDVAYPCAARLLQQRSVRTPGYHRFSPAVLPECCCLCGLRSSSDCPCQRHPDRPTLASCRCLSASASKSRCWYIVQCKGHRRSTVGPSSTCRRSGLAPTCARSHVSNRSLLVDVSPAWATKLFGFRGHSLERTSNGHRLSASILSIFRSCLKALLFCPSFPRAVVYSPIFKNSVSVISV
jgi:hypothetical protein